MNPCNDDPGRKILLTFKGSRFCLSWLCSNGGGSQATVPCLTSQASPAFGRTNKTQCLCVHNPMSFSLNIGHAFSTHVGKTTYRRRSLESPWLQTRHFLSAVQLLSLVLSSLADDRWAGHPVPDDPSPHYEAPGDPYARTKWVDTRTSPRLKPRQVRVHRSRVTLVIVQQVSDNTCFSCRS